MKLLDLTLPPPAENLAYDEALLNWCESGDGEEVLRFWESPEYFVVVGYADKVRNRSQYRGLRKKRNSRLPPLFRRRCRASRSRLS